MRYSVKGAIVEDIKGLGGVNVIESPRVGFIWADLTPSQVDALKTIGCEVREVTSVKVQETRVPTPVEAEATWSTSRILQLLGFNEIIAALDPPLTGKGLVVAVLDTGIRGTHESVDGRVAYSQNFTSGSSGDVFDHGTGVASIIIALAPECQLLDLKVLNDEGEGTDESTVLAIDKCLELWEEDSLLAPIVVNLSFGAPDTGDENSPLRMACRRLIDRGVFVMAAAGNDGPGAGTILTPGCERYVFCVGCMGFQEPDNLFVSSFSSRGPTSEGLVKPDLAFVGQDVKLASSASNSAIVGKSGTSFSTPWGAGVALLYWDAVARGFGWQPGADIPLGLDPSLWATPLLTVTNKEAIDVWLEMACLKPHQLDPIGRRIPFSPEKNNDYGYGVPFGPLMAQVYSGGVGITGLEQVLPMVVLVMMMGMLMPIMRSS